MNLVIPTGRAGRRGAAFTLIEIALSIAIVAFALVAIIGILPTGLEVQRENREDTIINGDGPLLIEAIRLANTNLALLTNNMEWIELTANGAFIRRVYATNLTAKEILGTICTPRYLNLGGTEFTNRTRALFRAASGPLATEATNAQDFAFAYLLSVEVIPQSGIVNTYVAPGGDPALVAAAATNLWDLRLIFEWPILRDATNNTRVGAGRRVFRTLVGSRLVQEDQTNSMGVVTNSLWFFTPDTLSAF